MYEVFEVFRGLKLMMGPMGQFWGEEGRALEKLLI